MLHEGHGTTREQRDYGEFAGLPPGGKNSTHPGFVRSGGGGIETTLMLPGHRPIQRAEHIHQREPQVEILYLQGIKRVEEGLPGRAMPQRIDDLEPTER